LKRIAWWVFGLLAGLFLLLTALLAAVAWMTSSPSGFLWLTQTASALSQDRLAFTAVKGDFSGSLSIGKLILATDQQRIQIENLRLEWQPQALWQRRVEIDLLAAQSILLTQLKPDPTPPELPRSLRLPFEVQLQTLDIASLEIVQAGQSFKFHDLRASLEAMEARYRLTRASVSTPWAEVRGEIELGQDAPFKLQGRLDAVREQLLPVQAEVRAEVQLSGTLAAPEFSLQANADGMQFVAQGEAAPFAKVRLPRLLVSGQGINPRHFSAAAPNADLAFSGLFEGRLEGNIENAAQGAERLLGTFSLSNRLAGRLDQQRLPLANLTGAVLGDASQAEFSSLLIDLGAAGQLTGDGTWRDARVILNLASQKLNLAELHRSLNATQLNTRLQFSGDAKRQQLSAEISGDVSQGWSQGRFKLTHSDAALRLESLDFSGQAGQMAANGTMQLDASRAFSATFDAARINPARIGKFPVARLNARGKISGALQPDLRLLAEFTLPPGELEGRPVKGSGRIRYEQQHLVDADIDLDLAGNLARFSGAYGRAGDRLAWKIEAPALARLNLGLAGRLRSNGNASGDPLQPSIEARLDAEKLQLPGGFAADKLNLQLNLQAAANGAFNAAIEARGVAVAEQLFDRIDIAAQGLRSAHTLSFDARQRDWRLIAGLTGGFDDLPAKLAASAWWGLVWRGQLTRAELGGELVKNWPVSLTAPAGLLLSGQQQQVNNLALSLAGGQLNLAQFSHQQGRVATRGSLGNLPLAPLLAMLKSATASLPPFSTDLRLNGDWNLSLAETLDGQFRLRRQSGDLRLNEPALNLGLNTLNLELNAAANAITAELDAISVELGHLHADARGRLLRAESGSSGGLIGSFHFPRSAPLAWNVQLDVADLRPLKPFLPLGMRVDAKINARLNGTGSLAAPKIEGRIDASQIRFAMPEEGVLITDGSLKLILVDERIRVQEGVLNGGSGRVVVSGEAEWKNPRAGLTLSFEKFAANNRSDRRVIVSGNARLNLDQKRLQLSGELTADRARLEMPASSRPELSSDVVIVGQPTRPPSASQRFPLALDLKLNLGKDFLFKGAGFDARLGGQLRVYTANNQLRGDGSIRVEEGRYAAYGQTLNIERGVLRFIGPIDNPGLDVLAVRKTATVTAGVQVRGTVQRPVATLYSDPALPDTEKLSWLVLGHGLSNGGQQEFALLQIAAGTLLSQADSVNFQSQLAEALNIDTFDVRAGDSQDLASSVVSVGKRLSSRTLLSYEQSLDGLSQVVKVLYQLTPRVRLEAQAGQQSSSFDTFYSVEYD
jgi:translocation and assembly module TamB